MSVIFCSDLQIDNRRSEESKAECLWPQFISDMPGIEEYRWYVRGHCKNTGWQTYSFHPRDVLRPQRIPNQETFFSGLEARDVMERTFLQAGFQFISNTYKNARGKSIRPLGFEKVPSLGLGSFFFTYRNIANNCPLALWWGVGDWYPLFPRKTNAQSDDF